MRLTDILLFALIYMLIIGVVSSLFNPSLYMDTSSEQNIAASSEGYGGLYTLKIDDVTHPGLDMSGGLKFITFILAALTLPIPGIPDIVRVLMLTPFYGSLAYFIWCQLPIPFRKSG